MTGVTPSVELVRALVLVRELAQAEGFSAASWQTFCGIRLQTEAKVDEGKVYGFRRCCITGSVTANAEVAAEVCGEAITITADPSRALIARTLRERPGR